MVKKIKAGKSSNYYTRESNGNYILRKKSGQIIKVVKKGSLQAKKVSKRANSKTSTKKKSSSKKSTTSSSSALSSESSSSTETGTSTDNSSTDSTSEESSTPTGITITLNQSLKQSKEMMKKLIKETIDEEYEEATSGFTHSLHGFICDSQFTLEGSELTLGAYDKLLAKSDNLMYTEMLRSQILDEVIMTAGLIPVVDFTDLTDEVISWTSASSSGSKDSGDAQGDGSMTEQEAWDWAKKVPYNHGTSTHDPKEAYDKLNSGTGADCYSLTAALYYIFNYKVGIKARDICYHSPYASSGSHHTIQLYRNGSWDDCADKYRSYTSTNFHVISSRSGEHVCRESGGTSSSYPAYSTCPYSCNG